MLIDEYEGQQLWRALTERVEVVGRLMAVARMQAGFAIGVGLHAESAEERGATL
ncbi:hypothetical protein D3C78_1978940 [compost metagenome]